MDTLLTIFAVAAGIAVAGFIGYQVIQVLKRSGPR